MNGANAPRTAQCPSPWDRPRNTLIILDRSIDPGLKAHTKKRPETRLAEALGLGFVFLWRRLLASGTP
jgi:hypothetical protein